MFWKPKWSNNVIELSLKQLQLLGVQASEIGFKLRTVATRSQFVPTAGPKFTPGTAYTTSSPVNAWQDTGFSFMGTRMHHIAGYGGMSDVPYRGGESFIDTWSPYYRNHDSNNSGRWSSSPNEMRFRGSPSMSDSNLIGMQYTPDSRHKSGLQSSSLDVPGSLLSLSPDGSALNSSELHRLSNLRPQTPSSNNQWQTLSRRSPISDDGFVTDQKSLEKLFKEEEEKERISSPGVSRDVVQPNVSYWSVERGLTDYLPVLKKYAYQPACRSPQSPKIKDEVTDNMQIYEAEKIWHKIGVNRDQLDMWTENLRKWLSETILVRLVAEIDKANRQMAAHGILDSNVGEATLSQLRQLALNRSYVLPTLHLLIPFLEITPHQEYLVSELRELAKGGCMSVYRWNRGGDFKGRPWNEQLPTDAEIIMHVLCCYLDGRLPPRPHSPDGRPFTQQHFIRKLSPSTTKDDKLKTHQLYICQTSVNPPHYNVIDSTETWVLPKGPSNLFQVILLFLHFIRIRDHGMLGSVNLGLSGINILWVLDT